MQINSALARSMPSLPKLTLEQIFDQSRTLQSLSMAKDEIESRENILEVPVKYDISQLKLHKSNTNKLLLAIQHYYRDEERLERCREKLQTKIEDSIKKRVQRKLERERANHKSYEREITQKISFLQQTRSSDRISYSVQCQQKTQKRNLNKLLNNRIAQLKKDIISMDREGSPKTKRIVRVKKSGKRLSSKDKQEAAMEKLNRDIQSIIARPMSSPLNAQNTKQPSNKIEIRDIQVPSGKEIRQNIKVIQLEQRGNSRNDDEATPTSQVSNILRNVDGQSSYKEIIAPYEQGLKDIDDELDQEKIQSMILSEKIAGLKPKNKLSTLRSNSQGRNLVRSSSSYQRRPVSSLTHNFGMPVGRKSKASARERPMSNVTFARSQHRDITIVGTSSSGHMYGVRNPKLLLLSKSQQNLHLLKRMIQQRNFAETMVLQPMAQSYNQTPMINEKSDIADESFIVSGSQKQITNKSPSASLMKTQNDTHTGWGDLDEVKTPFETDHTPFNLRQSNGDIQLRSTLPILQETGERTKQSKGPIEYIASAAMYDPTIPRSSVRVPEWQIEENRRFTIPTNTGLRQANKRLDQQRESSNLHEATSQSASSQDVRGDFSQRISAKNLHGMSPAKKMSLQGGKNPVSDEGDLPTIIDEVGTVTITPGIQSNGDSEFLSKTRARVQAKK